MNSCVETKYTIEALYNLWNRVRVEMAPEAVGLVARHDKKSQIEEWFEFSQVPGLERTLFDMDLEDMPPLLGHEEKTIRMIAEWRLEIGK